MGKEDPMTMTQAQCEEYKVGRPNTDTPVGYDNGYPISTAEHRRIDSSHR